MANLSTPSPADLLEAAARTFAERSTVYKDNYKKVGEVMSVLFPLGIPLCTADDHNRFHILMLSVVKLTRYAENWNDGGHSDSCLDAAVYWAMLESIDAEINQMPKPAKLEEVEGPDGDEPSWPLL